MAVDLCYPDPPDIDPRALTIRIRSALPGTMLVWAGPTSVLLRHERADPANPYRPDPADILGLPPEHHPFTDADRHRDDHLLHTVAFGTEPPDERDLSQCWAWPDASATLVRCRYQITISQPLGRGRDCAERVQALRATVDTAIALARPLATWWPASQQALPPGALVTHPLTGVVNIRLFRSMSDPEVTLTDTLGLYTLGLPDVQCQSRNLDPHRLSDLLFELAEYLCKHGDVLRPGSPVPGLTTDQQFVPSRQPAMVPPHRMVIDLDPGPGYRP
jgi:hypothetical protein